ncbi:MAG: hypothetical protein IBX55_13005 [Methyloprofundus sp.]|nr:hypothetical protein [Methyloprofundus sp.]
MLDGIPKGAHIQRVEFNEEESNEEITKFDVYLTVPNPPEMVEIKAKTENQGD